ncbi:hypothetical protein ACIQ9E_26550 [Streptomyces sp. NPDC094448]|uniref:hypothetical protein n=1 Tax=Streptomyces sp. NPDC094448 TaxID=3366063 RepID=UPI0037FDD052
MRRRRPTTVLLALTASTALLIGGAGQLAKMIIPDSPRAASAEVAPVLIGGFLIGAAAQLASGGGDADAPDRVISAMNKAELVGA